MQTGVVTPKQTSKQHMNRNIKQTPWASFTSDSGTDSSGGTSDVQTSPTTIITSDPLDTPVGDIDISYPLIPPNITEFVCVEADVQDNKAKTGKNLVLTWENTRELTSTKGDILPPGNIKLKEYLSTVPTKDFTPKMIGQRFAKLARGAGLPAALTVRDIMNNPTVIKGKIANYKVKKEEETAEFPERNGLGAIVIPG